MGIGDFVKLSNVGQEYIGYVIAISSNKNDLVLRTNDGNVFIENYHGYSYELLDYYSEYNKMRDRHIFSISKPSVVVVDCIKSIYKDDKRVDKDLFKIVIDADIIHTNTMEYVRHFSYVVTCYVMETYFGKRYIKVGEDMSSILLLWDILDISVLNGDVWSSTFKGLFYVNSKGVFKKSMIYEQGTSVEEFKESMR